MYILYSIERQKLLQDNVYFNFEQEARYCILSFIRKNAENAICIKRNRRESIYSHFRRIPGGLCGTTKGLGKF